MTDDTQHLEDSSAQEPQDPRPVFEGDWAAATGQERQAHLLRVNAWKRRQGLWGQGGSRGTKEPRTTSHSDAEVAAILGSGKGSAPLTPLGLQTLREVAGDTSAPASARASAASALLRHEEEAAAVVADEERDRVSAALSTAPLPDRLRLLERIVRRTEPEGWTSVFADPAAPAEAAEAAAGAAEAEEAARAE